MPGLVWTNKEKNALKRQIKRENRVLSDVEIPGRSINSIRAQAARLGLVEPRASRAKWSKSQRERLHELKRQGFSPQEIFDFQLLGEPPRTKWSITKQWGRMELADRRRSDRMKRKKRWSADERKKFTQYLLRHSKSQTPEQIAGVWDVARSTVSRWQNLLGVKVPRDQVLRMPYSQEKQRRARKRIRQANRRMWNRRLKEREESLSKLAADMRASPRPPREQTCTDCGQSWPRRREFFPHHEKKISIGTSRYFKHRCRLCENARRRAQAKRPRDAAASSGKA